MKKQNLILAVILMIILVIASSFIGTWRTFSKMKSDLDEMFINGIEDDGFSIQNDLNQIVFESFNLITVAKNYYPETDDSLILVSETRDNLISAQTPSEKYASNIKLTQAVTELYYKIKSTENIRDDYLNLAKQYYTEIQSRNDTMKNDGYNSEAKKFNDNLSKIPAVFFAPILGFDKAELFQ